MSYGDFLIRKMLTITYIELNQNLMVNFLSQI